MFIFLWRSGTFASSRKGNGRRNLATGILAGLAMALVLSYPMSLQVDLTSITRVPPVPLILIQPSLEFFYQLGYAAVTEEPLFRGFLWGFLRKAGWKDLWILVFQAILFMVAHIYYLKQAPISFWIIVPVASLLMGFLAWRTRSIVTSMAAHAAGNATTYTAGVLLALYSR